MTKQLTPQAPATMTPNGPAAAAIIAAAIGCFVIGLLTTLAEVSGGIKSALNWYAPTGPLSGKTSVGVIVFFIAWFVLARMWGTKELSYRTIYLVAGLFLLGGLLLTFPPIFVMFAPHE
jgi:hypothetical protein